MSSSSPSSSTPRFAYHFMELVEKHAYDSYHKFLTAPETQLKAQPAPAIAISYYCDGDLYMFDEFQKYGMAEFKIHF